MPTLSETMTLAAFSARVTAGTLNVGQIYTISDKGWVLQAHTNTATKPLHGALRMNNGDTLPEGIEPDEIWIDTGAIITDANDPVTIHIPIGYIFTGKGLLRALWADGEEFKIEADRYLVPITLITVGSLGDYLISISESSFISNTPLEGISYSAPGVSGDGYRAIIILRKTT